MQHREDDVDPEQAAAGADAQRLPVAPPDPVAADLNPHDLVAGREQALAHGGP